MIPWTAFTDFWYLYLKSLYCTFKAHSLYFIAQSLYCTIKCLNFIQKNVWSFSGSPNSIWYFESAEYRHDTPKILTTTTLLKFRSVKSIKYILYIWKNYFIVCSDVLIKDWLSKAVLVFIYYLFRVDFNVV